MELLEHAIPPTLQAYIGPPDPVTASWCMLRTPTTMLTVLAVYFAVVGYGQRWMRTRAPLRLRALLVAYNLFQVLLSLYICKEVLLTAIAGRYRLACTPLNTATPNGVRMASVFWLFYMSKMLDLIDTLFFVLRKKVAQITFLHMYHHSSMIFNWYIGCLYSPGGQAFLSVMLNSFVHAIMYTYYMLSAMGPPAMKYLWWKRYLTKIQMGQFVVVNAHLVIGLYNRCEAPFWLNCFTLTYVSTLVVLFSNFYYQSYKKHAAVKPQLPVKTATTSLCTSPDLHNLLELIGSERVDGIDLNAGGDYVHRKTL